MDILPLQHLYFYLSQIVSTSFITLVKSRWRGWDYLKDGWICNLLIWSLWRWAAQWAVGGSALFSLFFFFLWSSASILPLFLLVCSPSPIFFCHHSHLFFCKHQAWQREPVQICGGVIWGQRMLSQCTDICTYPNCFPWLLLFILFPAEAASLYSLSSCRWCSPLSGKWLGPGPRVAVTE